jgi:hypothetical protein
VKETKNLDANFKILLGKSLPTCEPHEGLYKIGEGWSFLKNGDVSYKHGGDDSIITHDKYCMLLDSKVNPLVYCYEVSFTQRNFSTCMSFPK